ncbi:MAG: hypothetical protein Q8Q85_05000 [Gemmatimonadales bacterium]|nr:hypothetical protein [Gemmatimonadales bacterium]
MPMPPPDAGWERRFVADPARTREAAEIYAGAGFEVRSVPARPGDQAGGAMRDGCETCWLAQAFGFQVIYTRQPGPGGQPVPRSGGEP